MNILAVLQALLKAAQHSYKIWQVPDSKLRKWTTLKKDAEKLKYKRPGDEFITVDYTHEDVQLFAIPSAEGKALTSEGAEVVLESRQETAHEEGDKSDDEEKIEEKMAALHVHA